MKTKVNCFPDELKLQVVQEYMDTAVSQRELMQKFNIRGNNTIKKWMRKFDLQEPDQDQIELQRTMAKQKEKTSYERELEAKVQKLEQQLDYEQLRTLALDTMIDIAERDLKISIRKKSGAKR
ncbi:MAG: transposase [Bacteroidales bacterium]|jgi:transposase